MDKNKIIEKSDILQNDCNACHSCHASLDKKKQQEIFQLEKKLEENGRSFLFLDEDDDILKEIHMETSIAKDIILQLETELRLMLKSPFRDGDLNIFSLKTKQLHDMVEQQDKLRHNRELFLQQYQADKELYQVTNDSLYTKILKLRNEVDA
jgi:hypothetical protein